VLGGFCICEFVCTCVLVYSSSSQTLLKGKPLLKQEAGLLRLDLLASVHGNGTLLRTETLSAVVPSSRVSCPHSPSVLTCGMCSWTLRSRSAGVGREGLKGAGEQSPSAVGGGHGVEEEAGVVVEEDQHLHPIRQEPGMCSLS
jgi:hypothetical protein